MYIFLRNCGHRYHLTKAPDKGKKKFQNNGKKNQNLYIKSNVVTKYVQNSPYQKNLIHNSCYWVFNTYEFDT